MILNGTSTAQNTVLLSFVCASAMLWLAVQRVAVLLEERSSITGLLQKGHHATTHCEAGCGDQYTGEYLVARI